jgi:hypothetical protein
MAAKLNPPAQRRKEEPHVGIFWVIRGEPLIDSTPLSRAEPYGDHLTHLHGHDKGWERFQRNGIAPIDAEYEQLPRGRVMFDTKKCQFRLLADRCILKRKDLVAKIKKEMRLPRNTKVGGDNHYRCFDCLREGLAE